MSDGDGGDAPGEELDDLDGGKRLRIGAQVSAFAAVAFVFGITFGVAGTTADMSLPRIIVMSFMFAGAAQFAALAIVSTGGAATAAFITAMFLNARYGLLALSVARRLPMRTGERLLAAWVLGDPGVVMALAEPKPERRSRVYWVTALWTAAGWLSGTVTGAIAGSSIGDPEVVGLDAALPVLMLAILGQHFRDRRNLMAAVAGAVIGVALIPLLSPGLPVLVGGMGAVVPLITLRREDGRLEREGETE
jgi:predicted branched-subunit amino acid permease